MEKQKNKQKTKFAIVHINLDEICLDAMKHCGQLCAAAAAAALTCANACRRNILLNVNNLHVQLVLGLGKNYPQQSLKL